jgi:hypothetical protein
MTPKKSPPAVKGAKQAKARVWRTDKTGSHLERTCVWKPTSTGSVLVDIPVAVLPAPLKSCRAKVRWGNLSEEDRIHEMAKVISSNYYTRPESMARACLALTGDIA